MAIAVRWRWFLAFTAVFAAAAALVFWGTWSLDVVPVMPDADTTYPVDSAARQWASMIRTWKFLPSDLIGLSGAPYFWQELRYALALYAAGVAVAFFCLGQGLTRLASYSAALFLAFCGYWCTLFSAGHYGFFVWMMYGLFAFGLADRALETGRWRYYALLGLDVAWASFQQQDVWLLFAAFASAYYAFAATRRLLAASARKAAAKRLALGTLLAVAVFGAVGAPNFKETVEHTLQGRKAQIEREENVTNKGADAQTKRWEFVTNWSMPIEDTEEFFNSRVHGDTSCPFVLSINRTKGVRQYTGALGRPMNAPSGNYRQHSLYVGYVTLLFALAGVVLGLKRRDATVAFFFAAALVTYSLSLGRHFAPAYRVVFALPFGDLIRCPVKWHHLTEFSLAVLAGFGVDALYRLLVARGLRARSVTAALAAVVLFGVWDLASEAHRFCAPLDVSEARRTGLKSNLTFLTREQFADRQVQAMVRSRRILSVANLPGRPDVFLVQVLQPFEERK